MNSKISVVINTYNEGKTLKRALDSVKWADEVIVCDMYSADNSVAIARKMGAKIIFHEHVSYVEPARNFAVSKASNEWVLILDPDEEVSPELRDRLIEMVEKPIVSNYVEIPRQNLIFGKWMKNSMWWPDFNIRFFRKGKVIWSDEIHRQPQVEGEGLKLPEEEKFAIIHHHYESLSQYLERLNRYTTVQAENLVKSGYKFKWSDLIAQPVSEFLGRFFANKGYLDGVHGLSLAMLQSFSHLVMYLKVWELEKFKEQPFTLNELKEVNKKAGFELDYWFKNTSLSSNPLKRSIQKIKNKFS